MDDESATETEVLIAGAGPVGLALALELQRLEFVSGSSRKNAARSTTQRRSDCSRRLSEVFAILGIAGKFSARFRWSARHQSACEHAETLTVGVQFALNGRDATRASAVIIIPQSDTKKSSKRPGRTLSPVERCRELIGFNQTADCVNSVVRHENGTEEPIRSRFLVSCGGAQRRSQSGRIHLCGATFPMRFLLADVTIDWDLADNEVQVWFHRDGSFAALPFGSQKWRLIVECADDSSEAAREVTIALLQDLAIKRTGKINVGFGIRFG